MHKVIIKNGHRTWFFRDEIVEIIGQDKLDKSIGSIEFPPAMESHS
ncbi:MAG: hypothetical protein JRH08_00835 [Deltaproteobacteria bacterium]|nr:hypothetical protein [Deltaproteobacteria bacterium]MBW2025708.1 hypothetical protein [Deltaproteobacteria bacterium]MBW2124249.1 hypothetical protein [Deltaproteobacteria bacterium]